VSEDGTWIVDNKLTRHRYVKNRFGIGKLIDVAANKTVPIKVKDHFNYAGDLY